MPANTRIPNAYQTPVERDPKGNLAFTRPWYLFFQSLGNLVGGQANSPESVAVGASPFTYEAQGTGILIVEGGTVTLLEYGRNAVFTALGITQGPIPIVQGDSLRITHAGAPNLTLVRQ